VRKKLGECLIQAGLISEQDLETALTERARTGERVGAVLVRLNLATERQITKAIAYQLGLPYLNLAEEPPDRAAMVLIPKDVSLARGCVAIKLETNLLTVAMSDPLLTSLVQDLELRTGHSLKQVVAARSDILDAIHRGYPAPARQTIGPESSDKVQSSASQVQADIASSTSSAELIEEAVQDERAIDRPEETDTAPDSAAIDELLDLVFNRILQSRASDVHIEPIDKRVAVRHRLDGVLADALELPQWVHEPLIARLKLLADIDAAETRLPQEGQLRVTRDDGSHAR